MRRARAGQPRRDALIHSRDDDSCIRLASIYCRLHTRASSHTCQGEFSLSSADSFTRFLATTMLAASWLCFAVSPDGGVRSLIFAARSADAARQCDYGRDFRFPRERCRDCRLADSLLATFTLTACGGKAGPYTMLRPALEARRALSRPSFSNSRRFAQRFKEP